MPHSYLSLCRKAIGLEVASAYLYLISESHVPYAVFSNAIFITLAQHFRPRNRFVLIAHNN